MSCYWKISGANQLQAWRENGGVLITSDWVAQIPCDAHLHLKCPTTLNRYQTHVGLVRQVAVLNLSGKQLPVSELMLRFAQSLPELELSSSSGFPLSGARAPDTAD